MKRMIPVLFVSFFIPSAVSARSISEVVEEIQSKHSETAMQELEHMGPQAAEALPRLEAYILENLKGRNVRTVGRAIRAFARIGEGQAKVEKRLLEWIESKDDNIEHDARAGLADFRPTSEAIFRTLQKKFEASDENWMPSYAHVIVLLDSRFSQRFSTKLLKKLQNPALTDKLRFLLNQDLAEIRPTTPAMSAHFIALTKQADSKLRMLALGFFQDKPLDAEKFKKAVQPLVADSDPAVNAKAKSTLEFLERDSRWAKENVLTEIAEPKQVAKELKSKRSAQAIETLRLMGPRAVETLSQIEAFVKQNRDKPTVVKAILAYGTVGEGSITAERKLLEWFRSADSETRNAAKSALVRYHPLSETVFQVLLKEFKATPAGRVDTEISHAFSRADARFSQAFAPHLLAKIADAGLSEPSRSGLLRDLCNIRFPTTEMMEYLKKVSESESRSSQDRSLALNYVQRQHR